MDFVLHELSTVEFQDCFSFRECTWRLPKLRVGVLAYLQKVHHQKQMFASFYSFAFL